MRILLWHGYLLSGTGSNVYTQAIAREWARAGHEVVVFCQEPEPERFDLAGAEVVRPDIGRLLPVFVLDRYEGLEPVLLQDMARGDRELYVARNAAALAAHLPADLVFANHVLLGGPVAAATGASFGVKAHGSELEYSMRGNAELEAWGARSLRGAGAVFVGSAHIRSVLEEVVGHVDRVHEVPPGVDVDGFVPRPRPEALAALLAECRADPPNPGNRQERLPDEGNDRRLAEFFAADAPTVLYFGKLLYNKGVHVLLEAVRGIGARTLVVGFGDYRRELERIAPPRTLFTGPLEHRHLVQLLAAGGRRRRPVDLSGGVRDGRRRGRGRRRPAARREALGPGGGGGRGSRRRTHPTCVAWRASRPATRSTSPTSCARSSRLLRSAGAHSAKPHGAWRWRSGRGRASPLVSYSPSSPCNTVLLSAKTPWYRVFSSARGARNTVLLGRRRRGAYPSHFNG